MAIVLRLLQENEIQLANDFFNHIYKTTRSIENFRWEFINGPFGKAIYVVAIDDTISIQTKIVGIQCAIPIEFISITGKTVLTAKSEDTLVDPSYRGQKIFERMYERLFAECTKAGIKYIWGFTPAQKAFERIGFEIPFKTEQALLVFNPFRAYGYLKGLNLQNKTTDKVKILMLSFLSFLKGLKIWFIRKNELYQASFENKNTVFQKFITDSEYYTLNESAPYIKWRLTDNPFSNQYVSYQYKKGEELVGDAIVNHRKNVSHIEQLHSRPGRETKSFLASLTKECYHKNAALIRVFCFSSNTILQSQGNALSQIGFTYLKRGNYFVWKSIDPTNEIKPEQVIINRLFTQGNS